MANNCASRSGAIASDVNATFIQASRLEVDCINESMGVQLFAGDIYSSEQNCSLIVSSTYPGQQSRYSVDACGHPDTRAKYACVPVKVYMFALGPLVCNVRGTAVLLLVKQRESAGACRSNVYFGVYTPATGTVRLRGGTAPRKA